MPDRPGAAIVGVPDCRSRCPCCGPMPALISARHNNAGEEAALHCVGYSDIKPFVRREGTLMPSQKGWSAL